MPKSERRRRRRQQMKIKRMRYESRQAKTHIHISRNRTQKKREKQRGTIKWHVCVPLREAKRQRQRELYIYISTAEEAVIGFGCVYNTQIGLVCEQTRTTMNNLYRGETN